MKRPTQTKYLSVKDYLIIFKGIEKENGFFSDEINKFLKGYNLPTPSELSESNLRVYMSNSVAIKIYNINEIKDSKINIHHNNQRWKKSE